VNDIVLENELYRTLTKIKYQEPDSSVSALINEMLKEYLHTYVLSKRMGHMLITKELVKTAVDGMNQEQIKKAAAENAIRYKEAAIIEHGRPSLASYLELIRAFAKANKFEFELSRNPDKQTQVIIVQFKMGSKFALYKAETYKILLQEFAEVERIEATDTSVFIEFKQKSIVETRISDQSRAAD
jgi:hypothetical protein